MLIRGFYFLTSGFRKSTTGAAAVRCGVLQGYSCRWDSSWLHVGTVFLHELFWAFPNERSKRFT